MLVGQKRPKFLQHCRGGIGHQDGISYLYLYACICMEGLQIGIFNSFVEISVGLFSKLLYCVTIVAYIKLHCNKMCITKQIVKMWVGDCY